MIAEIIEKLNKTKQERRRERQKKSVNESSVYDKMFGHSIELCISLLLLITLNSLCCIYGSLSGFYIDNGIDQTVMHHALSQDDVQEVEHEILEMLGLPERPRKKHSIHPSLR